MRVLAIDPGFGRLGVAVIDKEAGKETLIFSDCIETPKELPLSERLAQIEAELSGVISQYDPEELAIEKLFFANNQKTAMQVAEARGVVIATAETAGLSVYEYTPVEVKVAVTGSGSASKAQVSDMVKKLIQIEKLPRYDDEFDAIAIGLTHLATLKT